MYFNIYAIPVTIAALLMVALSLLIRAQKSAPGGFWFSLLMLSGAVYSMFYALEISSDSLALVRTFYNLEYIGIPFIPAFFLLFALSYTRGKRGLKPGLYVAVLSVPVVTSLLALTSNMHNIFISGGEIEAGELFPVFIFTPAPWYWVHQSYSIISITLSIILFIRMWFNVTRAFRGQVGIVLAGSLVPFTIYIVYLAGILPEGIDPNPFSFAFTGILMFLGISKFKLFSLSPLARNMLFDSIPDGVVVLDRFFRLVDFNRSAAAVFGIDQDDIGRPLGEVLDEWPEVLSFLTGGDTDRRFELSRITTDRTLFLECTFITLRDDLGVRRGQMLMANDVTGRKRAELEKDESDEKFESIFNNAPLGLMYYDKNGIIEVCNKYFTAILGSTDEKLTGFNMMNLSDKRMVDTIKKTFQGKNAVFEGEYTSDTGGKTVYVRAVFKPLLSGGKGFEGGLCIVEDITGRKNAEDKIKKNNAELQRLNAEKDRFFSVLAHDLRSPFSSFLGYTDILEEGVDTMPREMIRTVAGSLKESANNLYGLLENLLQWSRIQQGAVDYLPEEFQLRDKVLSCIEPLLTFANNKMIAVSYELPDDIYICADKKMFDTVIRNLFTNAVKFTPREGSVNITATSHDDELINLKFSDTGIGMSREMVDNLFRLDVKTSRTGTDGELSTGLGLILCKEFIEIHGGTITVDSSEGKGSQFIIRLNKCIQE